jgi:hypothetical protein
MKKAVTGVTGKRIFTDHWVNQRVYIKHLGKPFLMFSNALYLLNSRDSSKNSHDSSKTRTISQKTRAIHHKTRTIRQKITRFLEKFARFLENSHDSSKSSRDSSKNWSPVLVTGPGHPSLSLE